MMSGNGFFSFSKNSVNFIIAPEAQKHCAICTALNTIRDGYFLDDITHLHTNLGTCVDVHFVRSHVRVDE